MCFAVYTRGPGLGISVMDRALYLHHNVHFISNSYQDDIITINFSVNQGLEQSDTDSFQDSSLKLNVPGGGQSRSSSLLSESSSQPEIHPFFKDSFGKFIVLYSYLAQDENDLSVERGQLVTLLNKVDKTRPQFGAAREKTNAKVSHLEAQLHSLSSFVCVSLFHLCPHHPSSAREYQLNKLIGRQNS